MKGSEKILRRIGGTFFLFFFFSGLGYGQDIASLIVFECGDIGVEARRLLSNLNKERLKLEKKQQSLKRYEEELKILEGEVDKKLERLKELRKELDKLMAKKEEIEQKKVRKLSKIYQKRDPAGAAKTLTSMQKDLAVSILSMMRDKYAGKILDEMDKRTAVEYSTALGRPGAF